MIRVIAHMGLIRPKQCVRCQTEAAQLARMAHGRSAAMRYAAAFEAWMGADESQYAQVSERANAAWQSAQAIGVTSENLLNAAGLP